MENQKQAQESSKSRRILVTGGTGLIGSKLLSRLLQEGYDVNVLTRDAEGARKKSSLPVTYFSWNPASEIAPASAFENVTAVIHLAGESVAGKRWSDARKKEILESRTFGTRNLVQGIKNLVIKPEVLVSSSAIGFYGDRADEELNESSSSGKGFLSHVCIEWENEALQAKQLQVRTVLIRTGIVLDPMGGALKQMLPIFRLGGGGVLGNGKHWMSWIHVDDLVLLLMEAVKNKNMAGPVNGVAPNPVRNSEFTRVLAKCLRRPAIFPAPAVMIKLVFGEMSEIILSGQKVYPLAAEAAGFKFRYPELASALADLLAPGRKEKSR
jgi:uncharacterized protein (TIGR01777 family)